VQLGVINKNESTHDGMRDITEHMQSYVPEDDDNRLIRILSVGDQLIQWSVKVQLKKKSEMVKHLPFKHPNGTSFSYCLQKMTNSFDEIVLELYYDFDARPILWISL
jgi:hypothetical protein